MDSEGRLFVGDRSNCRIQIFTQDAEHLATWTQFSRPSGLYIDADDIFGWKRDIRIGSVRDGIVTAFIPDPEPIRTIRARAPLKASRSTPMATSTAPKWALAL